MAIASITNQLYDDVQHIVIDGASTDGTLKIIHDCIGDDAIILSELDNGIYHALNKGLFIATGEVVGFLHSDDFFVDSNVLSDVMSIFSDPYIDAVYGDLEYVDKVDITKVIRFWCAGPYSYSSLARGWMPPHPTLFIRRAVIEKWGGFDENFQIAADYDAILRYFYQGKIRPKYIPRVLVRMRLGGVSNQSLRKIFQKSIEDFRAIQLNGLGGLLTLMCKNFRKIKQLKGYLIQ